MKIALNCRSFLTPRPAGIGRYAKNLVEHLAQIDQTNDYRLYCRKDLFDFKRKLILPPSAKFKVCPDFFRRGMDAAAGPCDVVHYPSPEAIESRQKNIVVTVHDLIYRTWPQSHTQETIALTERAMASVVERACLLICVSESTRADLERYFPSTVGKTRVVLNGIDHGTFYRLADSELETARQQLTDMGIPPCFLLFVGTLEPRKNVAGMLAAFEQIKKSGYKGKLVIAGMQGWMMEKIGDTVRSHGLEKDVVFGGYLEDHQLRAMYNLCDVFLFPSFYEGFGFPIVEAMACGAPVVTSNNSACAEMAGDAALTVDPSKSEDISAAVLRVLSDPQHRQHRIERSLQHSKAFTFSRMAEETLAVYHECSK